MFEVVDFSEYCIFICIILCIIGFIFGIITADYFLGIILLLAIFVFIVSVHRIRKFGVAYAVMESVDTFKNENDRLTINVSDLENQNLELSNNNKSLQDKLEDMGKLIGIFRTTNKTAQEIQDDMISTLKKLESENENYTRLNKTHAFLLADKDNNGVLNKTEQETIKLITGGQLDGADTNNDSNVSRSEYLTF